MRKWRLANWCSVTAIPLTPASDASMFARAGGMHVAALTATSNRQWLTPPLPTVVPAFMQSVEHLNQLAITRDGSGLIGRTRVGEWLYWDIGPDTRPAEQIAREAALLNPDQTVVKNGLAVQLPESDCQALCTDDSRPPIWIGGFPQDQIPQRQPNLPANLVDLTAFYNEPLSWVHSVQFSTYRELAPGVHRFFGVDYDVRGIVTLSMKGFASVVDPDRLPPLDIRRIRPGIDRFAALNLLFAGFSNIQVEKNVRMRWSSSTIAMAAGNVCRSSIVRTLMHRGRTRKASLDKCRPAFAWRATNAGTPNADMPTSKIFSVRIANPHP